VTQPLRPGREPAPTRATSGDVRFFLTTAAAIVVIGLSIAAILWVLSRQGGDPSDQRATYRAFSAGQASALRRQVAEGGPVFHADLLAGSKGFWLDTEDGTLVALSVNAPGKDGCVVRWRGSVDRYVDCDGLRYRSEQLARFTADVPRRGAQAGQFLIDLRRVQPPTVAPPAG
jgi:hypothetical protein